MVLPTPLRGLTRSSDSTREGLGMKPTRQCTVPECTKNAKPGYVEAICPMHRERYRLHGTYDNPRPKPYRFLFTNGYWRIYEPDHPLVMPSNGYVQEHRAVLYDAIGPSDHPCNWCGVMVSWSTPFPDGLVVDHLNHDIQDNRPENLVASCLPCNSGRSVNRRTHCNKCGRALAGDNLRIGKRGGGKTRRICRHCDNERVRINAQRRRSRAA